MTDSFESYLTGLSTPAVGGLAVTPSDVTEFSQPSRAIWVGGTGDIAVRMLDQTTLTFVGVTVGTMLPLRVDQVLATGTTATNIVIIF